MGGKRQAPLIWQLPAAKHSTSAQSFSVCRISSPRRISVAGLAEPDAAALATHRLDIASGQDDSPPWSNDCGNTVGLGYFANRRQPVGMHAEVHQHAQAVVGKTAQRIGVGNGRLPRGGDSLLP
jgi:hypothetical protein